MGDGLGGLPAGTDFARIYPVCEGMDRFGELDVPAHAIAVAPDVDDVAPVEQAVEQRGGHDLVAEDAAPLLEAIVRGQDSRGMP